LEFSNFIALQYFGIEKLGIDKGLVKPSVHRVPRQSFDPRDGRLPDAVYGHGCDIVEAGARTLQTVVCCSKSRREGPTTVPTTVSLPPSLTGFVEGMTDDIALSMLSEMRTVSVWTGEVFEAVFVVHTCVITHSVSKHKEGSTGSRNNFVSNNT
jgi:hypothetical protein